MWLVAVRLDAQCSDPAGNPRAGQSRRRGVDGLRRHARILSLRRLLVRQFAAEGIEVGADQIFSTSLGHAGDRPRLPLPAQSQRYRAGRRPLLLQLQSTVARAPGSDRRAFPTRRPGRISRASIEALATHRPRLYITNAALHNPTGATPHHRLLTGSSRAAAAHDLTIIEDESSPTSSLSPRRDLPRSMVSPA